MAEDPPRKVGRPKLPEASTRVTAWVKGVEYDRLHAIARRREESVSAVLRRFIARGLNHP